MRKILLLLIAMLFVSQIAQAKEFRTYKYCRSNYQNGVYYNNPRNFYNYRYNSFPKRYYYNQRPVIYKRSIKQSMNDEKFVSEQFTGLGKMERKIFQQIFNNDTPIKRIERLEQKMFGTIQSGNIDDRFDILKNAIANYKAYNPHELSENSVYNNYRQPVFTGTVGSNWRNTLWGNFKNQFTGMPTGFTPAMDPAYMDYFEAERAMLNSDQSTDYQTRNGYHRSNVNRGMHTKVTILD